MKHKISVFGEVLFDCFPNGANVLGGAPFNVAWHLQAFGLAPQFISRIGKDGLGERIKQAMLAWNMGMDCLQTDANHPTGQVVVSVENHEPSYDIRFNSAYDFIEATANIKTSMLYHGSLALRHQSSAQALAVLKKNYQGKIFMDVNLRQPWWQKQQVLAWVEQADWVKLNQQELAQLQTANGDLIAQAKLFCANHGLTGLIVTKAEQGALLIKQTGDVINAPAKAVANPVDAVGAGDAFAAVFLLGLQLNWSLPIILERAQAFAAAIVGKQGAIVQDKTFYQPFIQAWGLTI